MTDKLVRVEQVHVKGLDLFADLNKVRTAVRTALYGRTEAVGAIVEVVWRNGDVEEWTFDHHVGFPVSPVRDWYVDWISMYS